MKHILLFVLVVFKSILLFSQNVFEKDSIDQMPKFNFKEYTSFDGYFFYNINMLDFNTIDTSKLINRVGFLSFTVDSNGKTTNIKILRSINESFDSAVMKIVEFSPIWIPGKLKGKPYPVDFTIQFKFPYRIITDH